MWIQILLITVIVVLAVIMMRRTGADSHLAIRRLLLLLFVIAAVLSILFPQGLTWLARLVGVGRGTDLVLYALVTIFLSVVYSQHRKNVALQRNITLLTRRMAVNEALARESAVETTRVRPPDDSGPAS
ncbi:DUF2304 domain-containing protein [Microbacterium soli]|uniref:DUF2304 domain-containing protein n=1 Tax=Microbacterium soli TaxID=446075 RepID=A0ABP7MP40_9MICO